jgi:hypothetical protein
MAHRKPVTAITDRAKRYRAQHPNVRPKLPKRCYFCGSTKNVGVHHLDGNEDHGNRQNLGWACKRCNAKIAHWMKKAGIGKRVEQFNPSKASRKSQMLAYGQAIKVMRGEFEGDIGAAMETIARTDPDVRSSYTSKSWAVRRDRYGPSGRS